MTNLTSGSRYELEFLHPLDVRLLWGVGPVTADKLRARGLHTVGQVAAVPEAALAAMLGPAAGRHLHALARNHDPRRIVVGRRRSSIGSQRALGRRRRTRAELEAGAEMTVLVPGSSVGHRTKWGQNSGAGRMTG